MTSKVTAKVEEYLRNCKNDYLNIDYKSPVCRIVLNRPNRSNAMTLDMMTRVTDTINKASKDPAIKFIAFYGNGKSFCSGNDLSNFQNPAFADLDRNQVVEYMAKVILRNYTLAWVNCEKPIVGIVQGQVQGMAFTTLAHYDRIFAVKDATFRVPFVASGQGPEMCCSYTFPKLFGKKLADELILQGKQTSVQQLFKWNFCEVHPTFQAALKAMDSYLNQLDSYDFETLYAARKLIRDQHRPALLDIAKKELDNLEVRWNHPEFSNILMKYFTALKTPQAKL